MVKAMLVMVLAAGTSLAPPPIDPHAPRAPRAPQAPTPPTAPASPATKAPEAPAPKVADPKAEAKGAASKPAEAKADAKAKAPTESAPSKAGEAPAAKPRAAGEPEGDADEAAGGGKRGDTAPSINAGAFRGELRRRRAPEAAPAEPKSERARLEELAAEIAKAREALREDTARLQTMLQQPKPGAAEGGGAARMPVGDPLRPGGTASGPPKEGYRGQVELVSKAMKGMKPEQAAAIVARLDRPLAAEILRRMPTAEAGGVLGQLKPELAADLATEIATRPPLSSRSDAKEEGK